MKHFVNLLLFFCPRSVCTRSVCTRVFLYKQLKFQNRMLMKMSRSGSKYAYVFNNILPIFTHNKRPEKWGWYICSLNRYVFTRRVYKCSSNRHEFYMRVCRTDIHFAGRYPRRTDISLIARVSLGKKAKN